MVASLTVRENGQLWPLSRREDRVGRRHVGRHLLQGAKREDFDRGLTRTVHLKGLVRKQGAESVGDLLDIHRGGRIRLTGRLANTAARGG